MSVVGFGCVRSCGVTTAALALARGWPARESGEQSVVLAECDPAGGSLAGRLGLGPEPGLVSLAAAARRRANPGLVIEHCQALPGGPLALIGPPSGEQARAALGMLAGLLGSLDAFELDVLVDCGRLDPASLVLGVFAGAGLSVLLVRPELADLHALAAWLPTHRARILRLGVVLVGSGPYPPGEVSEALDVEVLGTLPIDPHSAALLGTAGASGRAASRTALARAARSLAERLAARLAGPPAGSEDPVVEPQRLGSVGPPVVPVSTNGAVAR